MSGERKIGVEKLIRFFKGLSGKKNRTEKRDYEAREQTEEEYQREQDEWMRQVEKRRKNRENKSSGEEKK